ncbi:MAG: hypothetical protein EKK40_18945 [Bradyrhizobiaceae bacterium]|nr:MAG: hypothetical protein EKK40_18945 [Bradyrhizobiaceae bacterium]
MIGLPQTTTATQFAGKRRRRAAIPLRDIRYFVERVRSAQLVPRPISSETVGFGHSVTLRRGDGSIQEYRIVGEDEADPKAGSISFVSPVARALMGKSIGDVAKYADREMEIIGIA